MGFVYGLTEKNRLWAYIPLMEQAMHGPNGL